MTAAGVVETVPHTHDLIIIGAGPAGIEAGLAAASAGLDFLILERGRVGENIRRWGFVSMFSPWRMNVSSEGRERADLEDSDADSFPTGEEYIKRYLKPLSQHPSLQEHIALGVSVLRVGRDGTFKSALIGEPSRAELPFIVLAEKTLENGQRAEVTYFSRAVIDASGVYGNHRWLGSGGIPCLGERAQRRYISYELMDITPIVEKSDRQLHLAIIGAGFSACTLLESAKALNESGKKLNISWVTAGPEDKPVNEVENDPLPCRARLAEMANALAERPPQWLNYMPGYTVTEIKNSAPDDSSAIITLRHLHDGSTRPLIVQRIFALVGYVPDRRIYEELQVHECWATSGPMKLAVALLSQQGADCLELQTEGDTLLNPEPNFFIIGAKSYGRNPDFLIDRLKEQVTTVMEALSTGE